MTPTIKTIEQPCIDIGQVWCHKTWETYYFTIPHEDDPDYCWFTNGSEKILRKRNTIADEFNYLGTFTDFHKETYPPFKQKMRRWWTCGECAGNYLSGTKWLYRKIGTDFWFPGEFHRPVTGEWYILCYPFVNITEKNYQEYERTRNQKNWELLGVPE